jgi:hypothetical protein
MNCLLPSLVITCPPPGLQASSRCQNFVFPWSFGGGSGGGRSGRGDGQGAPATDQHFSRRRDGCLRTFASRRLDWASGGRGLFWRRCIYFSGGPPACLRTDSPRRTHRWCDMASSLASGICSSGDFYTLICVYGDQSVVHVLNQGDDAWGNGFPPGFARTSQENNSTVGRRLANGTRDI